MVRTLRRHKLPQNRQLKMKLRSRLYLTTNTLDFCRHESSFLGVFYKQTKSNAVRLKSGTVRRSFSETFHVQPFQSTSTTNTLGICRHGTHEGPSQVADDGHHNLGHLRLHYADYHVLRGGRLLQTQRRFRVGPAPASPSRQQVDVQPRQRVEGLRALRDGTLLARRASARCRAAPGLATATMTPAKVQRSDGVAFAVDDRCEELGDRGNEDEDG